MSGIKTITVLGTGRVARHLLRFFRDAGYELHEIYGRNRESAAALSETFNVPFKLTPEEINTDSDLYVIAVSDDAVESVSEALPEVSGIVVHTSGSTPCDALKKHVRAGVFYPLQTFSTNAAVNWSTVLLCVEGSDRETSETLISEFGRLMKKAIETDSKQRAVLHLSAVFACNFSNYMYTVAQDLLEENGLEFDFLRSLVTATAEKAAEIKPDAAQTGPAVRGDEKTIEKHVKLLADRPETADLYKTLSKLIQKRKK